MQIDTSFVYLLISLALGQALPTTEEEGEPKQRSKKAIVCMDIKDNFEPMNPVQQSQTLSISTAANPLQPLAIPPAAQHPQTFSIQSPVQPPHTFSMHSAFQPVHTLSLQQFVHPMQAMNVQSVPQPVQTHSLPSPVQTYGLPSPVQHAQPVHTYGIQSPMHAQPVHTYGIQSPMHAQPFHTYGLQSPMPAQPVHTYSFQSPMHPHLRPQPTMHAAPPLNLNHTSPMASYSSTLPEKTPPVHGVENESKESIAHNEVMGKFDSGEGMQKDTNDDTHEHHGVLPRPEAATTYSSPTKAMDCQNCHQIHCACNQRDVAVVQASEKAMDHPMGMQHHMLCRH